MKKENNLAPVVVFSYNRVDHLEKTLKALSSNYLAEDSALIVFSDGPRADKDEKGVNEVRNFLETFKKNTVFKSIEIVISKENKGLADSIISGVTRVITKFKKVIVVEDDVITSKYFLMYMNDGLNMYKEFKNVGSMASFVPNINIPKVYENTVFASMRPSSIAWATWIDRWQTTNWELENYHKEKYSLKIRKQLNSWGNDVAGRLDRYVAGYNNSWAVRFTVSRIRQEQCAIHPYKSISKHIGFDGSGTNTTITDGDLFDVKELNNTRITLSDTPPELDFEIQKAYLKQYRRSRMSAFGEFVLVAILGFKKNSLFVHFSRKISSFIKSVYE